MSKKQALTEFHRGSILAAAERLFAEKGIEKTTMDDIARVAEYSKATLYVYFQSKEEIVNAILLSGMVLLKKKIHEALESNHEWLQAYDAATGAIPLAQAGETVQKSVSDILRVSSEIDAELADFLVRGAEAGLVHTQVPPIEMVLLFWAALAGMVRTADNREAYIRERTGLSREDFLHHGARMLLHSITRADQ